MSTVKRKLETLATRLKEQNALPKYIDISRLGSAFLASAYDEKPNEVISERVSCGMGGNPDLAVLKALVEMVERRAFHQGRSGGEPACQTERSDGFAAMPLSSTAAEDARRNAFQEAVERFVWAQWWDDTNIGHTIENVSLSCLNPREGLLADLIDYVPLKEVYRIQPKLSEVDARVVIYFAYLDPVGVISGGACDEVIRQGKAEFRALCELARHGLALMRMMQKMISPTSFYEKRLYHFGATSEGESQVRARLAASGRESIRLPKLKLDQSVPHQFADTVYVHRCLFEDQPPFVGGSLERLCL